MSRYATIRDGEWFYPKRDGYLLACCDCGLVHTMNFRIIRVDPNHQNGSHRILGVVPDQSLWVGIQATRNRRATAAKRRNR